MLAYILSMYFIFLTNFSGWEGGKSSDSWGIITSLMSGVQACAVYAVIL